ARAGLGGAAARWRAGARCRCGRCLERSLRARGRRFRSRVVRLCGRGHAGAHRPAHADGGRLFDLGRDAPRRGGRRAALAHRGAVLLIERAMLHFAYGSNMSRALMGARCPRAEALGTGTLAGWRFVINPEGFGSIAPRQGSLVHGVLWRLTVRDLVAINAYESVDTGFYFPHPPPGGRGGGGGRRAGRFARPAEE